MNFTLKCGTVVQFDQRDLPTFLTRRWHVERRTDRLVYVVAFDGSRKLYLHRVLLGLGRYDGRVVDHVNFRATDCRRRNMRVVTARENVIRCRPRRGGTSKYRGVFRVGATGRWRATVTVQSKRIKLGDFRDERDAARARDDAAVRLLPACVPLNFPRRRRGAAA